VSKTALNAAISAANTAKSGVEVNTAAASVPEGTKWVTQTEMNALTTAIAAAQTVADNTAATQTAVDTATTALTTATGAFTNAQQDGTAPVGTEPITVNFWVDESDGAFSVSAGSVTIDQNGSFTATVTDGYTAVQWYVDGIETKQTASVTISGATYSDDLGIHRLSVTASKNGAYYSKEITFTVIK
jgi:hypothetical protein